MAKRNTIQEDTGEKGWVGLEFSGFEPDDTRSSLLRRWTGRITAFRSDGEVIIIPIVSEQSDTPYRVGQDLLNAFRILEGYRNCECRTGEPCPSHSITGVVDAASFRPGSRTPLLCS